MVQLGGTISKAILSFSAWNYLITCHVKYIAALGPQQWGHTYVLYQLQNTMTHTKHDDHMYALMMLQYHSSYML